MNAQQHAAFTSIWSNVIRDPGKAGKTSVFVCSDDDDAKAVITALAEGLGIYAAAERAYQPLRRCVSANSSRLGLQQH